MLTLAAAPLAGARAHGVARSPRLARGVSFHHALNWPALEGSTPRYLWPPFAAERYALREEDLMRARALGFDFIRLTLDPGLWIARGGEALEALYKSAVERVLAAGLNLVLDLHPVGNHPDFTPARLVGAPEYADVVARAAALLAAYPPARVALELFNEPPLDTREGEARWAAIQLGLHARARAVAPDLTLVLTGAHWGDGAALTRLDAAPFRGSNVVYTFHYYAPHAFTHQGLKSGPEAYVGGAPWPLTPEAAREAEGEAEQAVAQDTRLDAEAQASLRASLRRMFAGEAARPHDETSIARDFDAVREWANAQGVAPQRVWLGEFGCVLSSRGRATGAARLDWLAHVRSAAEARGFGWAYWAYKGFGGMELVGADGALHGDLVAPLGLRALQ